MSNCFYETINYSFISPRFFDMLQLPGDNKLREVIKVANPLSEEQSIMRTLLLPGLLDTASRNLARKNSGLALFEMGAVFYPQADGLPREVLKLGAVTAGRLESNWLKQDIEMDFYYLKGVMENLFNALGIDQISWVEANDPSYHPGRSAFVLSSGKLLGIVGEIHPQVRQNFDIKARACAFELDVAALFNLSHQKVMMEQITRYPAVERDLAIVVDKQVKACEAAEIITECGGDLLKNIQVFDIYAGEQVAAGSKSMAFRLTFQSSEKTLTESEVSDLIDKVRNGLKANINAVLR
jgi:phenylalanyl-tRNA synthetase beta chain